MLVSLLTQIILDRVYMSFRVDKNSTKNSAILEKLYLPL